MTENQTMRQHESAKLNKKDLRELPNRKAKGQTFRSL